MDVIEEMKYHNKTIDFLEGESVTLEDAHHPSTIDYFKGDFERLPMTSNITVDQLNNFEKESNLALPDSVKEWLLFPKSRLWFYVRTKNHIHINEADEFELFETDKIILSIFTDEIGVTEWGFEINGTEDPPVLTKWTDYEEWYEASPTFSKFIYEVITENKYICPPQ